MNLTEHSTLLIDAHRDYLRSLYHPSVPAAAPRRSRRAALAALLIRFGHWIDARPSATPSTAFQPSSAGCP